MQNTKNGAHELAVDFIYTALLQLMQTKAYKDITITDITRKAGVSRMAYYRNYTDKDDILLRHLEHTIQEIEAKMKGAENLSEKTVWEEIIAIMQNDPIIEKMLEAGLLGRAFPTLKDSIMRIYGEVFHWDLTDEDTVLMIYQRLGSMFGFRMYMIEQKQELKTDMLVKHLMSLTQNQ